MGPAWGPSGADRTQVGPMLAPWTLLTGGPPHDEYHTIHHLRKWKLSTINLPSITVNISQIVGNYPIMFCITVHCRWCLCSNGTAGDVTIVEGRQQQPAANVIFIIGLAITNKQIIFPTPNYVLECENRHNYQQIIPYNYTQSSLKKLRILWCHMTCLLPKNCVMHDARIMKGIQSSC